MSDNDYLLDSDTPPPQPHVAVTYDHIERLQHAVEGECDGLMIDGGQALAILSYVFHETPSNPPTDHVVGEDFLDVEDIREQKLATIVAPDNGTPDEVLAAVLECATAWVPEARIIGNVRAGDIARAVRAALAKLEDQP